MYYDIIIIGGGASGLCTAIKTADSNHSVLVIEHKDRVGKKILSTGNGKCNLTNRYCRKDRMEQNPEGMFPYFPAANRPFAESVINRFSCEDTIRWFEELGVLCEDKNGYIYPHSEQASSILDTLRYAASLAGVQFLTDYQPVRITKKDTGFEIDRTYRCKKLVLACGGMASAGTGSDGSGYTIASSFGHRIIKPLPALCGLKCAGDCFKSMQKVRAECRLRLYETDWRQPFMEAYGNVQFNSYGISGIPAMQLSSVAGRFLEDGKKLHVNIEFLPQYEFDQLAYFIAGKLKKCKETDTGFLPAGWILTGLLNKKIIGVIFHEMELKPEQSLKEALKSFRASKQFAYGQVCGKHLENLDEELIFAARMTGVLKHFSTSITGTCGFNEAQVTSGGVCVSEINSSTMESLLVPGLYFTGEIMDIDGICGGYNLQWAWATADAAANALRKG